MERKDLYKGNTFTHKGVLYTIIETTVSTVTIREETGTFKGETQTLTKNSLLYSLNRN